LRATTSFTPAMLASRRQVIVATLATGAAVCAGCSASTGIDRKLAFPSLAEAGEELSRLALAKERTSSATWNWAQTVAHCAQSIEYSMSGFPEPKSALFQSTAGAAAFRVFAWRGRMTHDLAEPIPGAPALATDTDPTAAVARLRAAIQAFRQWPGELRPHFAYGSLDKRDYDLAHAMHLANHFSQFEPKA